MNCAPLRGLAAVSFALALAVPARADEPRAGSVLVFPVHHADATRMTLISVTNTHTWKPVRALYRYVMSSEAPDGYGYSPDCGEFYRAETLTAADTVTTHTLCHAGPNTHGYLVVVAQSATGGGNVSHDYLIGSELVIQFGAGFGGLYQLTPAAYRAVAPEGQPTDADFDGRLDFDGIEYETLPDDLLLDAFLGLGSSRLALLSLADDRKANVSVQFSIWNDNEQALSATFSFRCWFEDDLTNISAAFSESFLANNTPDDPSEVDFDCDGVNDFESGWAKISGTYASSSFSSQPNPVLLGALTGGRRTMEGGRLLWGTNARSNGQF